MSSADLQNVLAMAKSDSAFFEALRNAPESAVANYTQISKRVNESMRFAESVETGMFKAGFHDGCRCTSCGCGGSM
jgi:hypothetical protein